MTKYSRSFYQLFDVKRGKKCGGVWRKALLAASTHPAAAVFGAYRGPKHRKGKALPEKRAIGIVNKWAVRVGTPQPVLGEYRCFEYGCGPGQALAQAVFGPGFGDYAPGVSGACTARCPKVSGNEGN